MSKFKEWIKSNKVVSIIIAAVVLLAIAVLLIILLVFNKKSNTILENVFNPKNPIVISKDSKYGYITSEGKVMINPVYNGASSFSGDYAIVSSKDPSSSSSYVYQVIDKKGKVKATTTLATRIKYVSKYSIWIIDGVLYNGKMKAITKEGVSVRYVDYGFLEYTDIKNGKTGIMNSKGKVIYSWNYSNCDISISKVDDNVKEYYARISNGDDKVGIINLQNGKMVYEDSKADVHYISVDDDNIFYIEDDKTYDFESALYIENGKIAFKYDKEEVELSYYTENVLRIEFENYKSYSDKYKYYDLTSKKLLSEKPTEVDDNLSEVELAMNIKKYSCGDTYGIMSGDKVFVSCVYDRIEFLPTELNEYMSKKYNENIILARKNENTIVMNYKTKKELFVFNSKYVDTDYDSTFITGSSENGETIVYNLISKKSMKFDKNTKVTKASNYIVAKKDNISVYYNTNLKQIYSDTQK